MIKGKNPQETPRVARTAVTVRVDAKAMEKMYDRPDRWQDLLDDLRSGPWINLEIVLEAFEKELDFLMTGTGNRYRANCLAKLRLVLIEALIQSAPEAYSSKAEEASLESFSETARFLDLFELEGRNAEDLRRLDSDEYGYICNTLIGELAKDSRGALSPVQISIARLATPYRQIRRVKPSKGRQFASKVLSPMDDSAVGAELPVEVARSLWYVFQAYGKKDEI